MHNIPDVVLPSGAILSASHPMIMGIVNVTPDSFSDGGLFLDRERAITHALQLLDEGADILDIGGESTRPGADPVSEKEELARTVPVIEGILEERPSAIISIDTTKARVAEDALKAGAQIINDVSALSTAPEIAAIATTHRAPVVLMHRRGLPKTMQLDTHYDNLIAEQLAFFKERIAFAMARGIAREQIILDPGIGFGKSTAQNCELIRHLEAFSKLGHMILLGTSRKSFIGHLLGAPVEERLFGTAASVACGVMAGAHIVRVHDVREMREVVTVAAAITKPSRAAHLP